MFVSLIITFARHGVIQRPYSMPIWIPSRQISHYNGFLRTAPIWKWLPTLPWFPPALRVGRRTKCTSTYQPWSYLPACPRCHMTEQWSAQALMSYTHGHQEQRKEQFLVLIDSTIILFHYNVAPTLILSPALPRCESTLDSRRLCGKACPSFISTHQLGNQRSQHSTTTTVQPATLPPMS